MSPASRRSRPPSRVRLLLTLLLLWLPARASSSTLLDPAHTYRRVTTAHFVIYFHQGEERLAARLATIAEDVWTKVSGALSTRAPRRTHVILADQTEAANGWATPLPYPTIFVTAAAPRGSEFIGNTDDWLRLVFTHELTHIVHLERSDGWARIVRGIFGRTSIAFPNVWLPAWQIEGLASWEESRLTGAGRLSAGDFRGIEREAARAGVQPPLDRVNGGLTAWPAGLAPYAFGLGFHEYLANKYGDQRLGELAARTSRSLPFFGSRAFKGTYGRSLGDLWRDYQASLSDGPATAARPDPSTQLTHHGHVVVGPRFAAPSCDRCPEEIVFTARGPDRFPSLQAVDADGTSLRRLADRYLGSTAGTSRDAIVFDQQELRRNVGLYSDLYRFDRHSGRVTRLTHDQRLQDPDLAPDGSIVCVREDRGRRDLVLVAFGDGESSITTLVSEPDTQFNTPRWSPDAKTIAVERHRLGAESEIVVVDVESRHLRVIASAPGTRIVTPAWRPDGGALVAAADFDGGPFDLYEFPVAEPAARAPRRLTTRPGGAVWPALSADGRTLVFVGYTAAGFDLFSQGYPDAPPDASIPRGDGDGRSTMQDAVTHPGTLQSTPYLPWRTLRPTSWSPIVDSSDGQLRVGVAVTGADVLGRHAYGAWASWRVRSDETPWNSATGAPDWGVGYAYDRWRPTLFASASAETKLAAIRPDASDRIVTVTVRQREEEAGVLLPVRHVRSSSRLLLSLVHIENEFALTRGQTTQRRLASRLGLAANTSQVYGYSISPERGVSIGATAELARPAFGATDHTTTLTVDARAYVPGVAPHHVLAVRIAGGSATGRGASHETFFLGGAGPNVSPLDFDRDALSLLRAFPVRAFAGQRLALANLDYRFPIGRPQRGYGTWPAFLHAVHGSIFVDAGQTWTRQFTRRDLKAGAGAELSFDVIAAYSFPFTIAIGAAHGRDGATRERGTTVYARIGKAF